MKKRVKKLLGVIISTIMVIGFLPCTCSGTYAQSSPYFSPTITVKDGGRTYNGAYIGKRTVTITCPEDWSICYKTDGSQVGVVFGDHTELDGTMTESSSVTISVEKTTRISAFAYQPDNQEGYVTSQKADRYITILEEDYNPTISNSSTSSSEATISAPEGWALCYTVSNDHYRNPPDPFFLKETEGMHYPLCYDTPSELRLAACFSNEGENPTVNEPIYNSMTIKAIAFKYEGGLYRFSSISGEYYVFHTNTGSLGSKTKLALEDISFRKAQEGYSEKSPESVFMYNQGLNDAVIKDVTISGKDVASFELDNNVSSDNNTIPADPLSYGGDYTMYSVCSISPQNNLPAGNYEVTVNVFYNSQNDKPATAKVSFTVEPKPPAFSLASGSYTGPQQVELTSDSEGAVIYYTTNGETPTETDAQYTGPITLSESATIKAIAVKGGVKNQTPAEAVYTIMKPPTHTLTVSYVYADGRKAKDPHTETLTEGAKYSVVSPGIPGFTPDKTTVSGTMGTADVNLTVTYTANPVVKNYEDIIYTVKVTDDGYGTATATPASGKTGTQVKLTATPKSGYEFAGWELVSGLVTFDKSKASTTFTIKNSNVEVKALFKKKADPTPTPTPDPNKTDISDAMVKLSANTFTYNNKTQKPAIRSVVLGKKTLKAGKDYTVTFPKSSKNAGTYKVTVTGKGKYTGSVSATYTVKQAANTLKVSRKKVKLIVDYSIHRKKDKTISRDQYLKVSKNRGAVTYKMTDGDENISVSSKTGRIKISKELEKGTYPITVSVKAAGNKNYKALTKKVTVKVVVK